MRHIVALIIMAVLMGGCATQLKTGKVVYVTRVEGATTGDALVTVNAVGGSTAGALTAGGATVSSAVGKGLAVGGAAAIVEAVINREKTVTVYYTDDHGVRIYRMQKPTPEIALLQKNGGGKAIFVIDKDGDSVLVPYEEKVQ